LHYVASICFHVIGGHSQFKNSDWWKVYWKVVWPVCDVDTCTEVACN
jgi:hypothetical protein